MKNSGESMPTNIHYIFDDKLFIGYVKFYNAVKGFGYIVSNNAGMSSNKIFWYKYNDFYIDSTSFDQNIRYDSLVMFRPAYVNGRLKAINVVQYDVKLYKEIAIDTILSNNNIKIKDRQRITIPSGHSGISYSYAFGERNINIYKLSGIKRSEILDKCCEMYKDFGINTLLKCIDNFISACGGDKEYYSKLKYNYLNKENEYHTIRLLFSFFDKKTAKSVILKHPVFQLLAPYHILQDLVGQLNEDYYIPRDLLSEHCEKKLRNIINNKEVFSVYYSFEQIRTHCPAKRNRLISLLKKSPDKNKDDLNLEVTKQIKEGITAFINMIDDKSLEEKKEFIVIFTNYLSKDQKNQVLKSIQKKQ